MNAFTQFKFSTPLALAVAAVLAAACSSVPTQPEGLDAVRGKLSRLQSDPQLSSRAPVAIKEAEAAVRTAETPTKDLESSRHLVFVADRKVELAEAQAQTRLMEDQRKGLSEQQQTARLDARTREAERARSDARSARDAADDARRDESIARSDATIARRDESLARTNANIARQDETAARTDANIARSQTDAALTDASIARNDANSARVDANVARNQTDAALIAERAAKRQAEELRIQIAALNAKTTERGLVVTLGDVLFATGESNLKSSTANHLDKLAAFLNKYPDRSVAIEGHTDNVGSDVSNQGLSQRRADSVKSYLVGHGVGSVRLSATGKGESTPISENESATGRQQNRRVEVIIENDPVVGSASLK
jgi:outer membrane protein OmpA-like peptidoglycan-associated protein